MPHREKISRFAKARLIEAYQIDEDFLEIAKLLKTKRETAYTIIARKDNDMGQHEFINITDERLARQSLADYRFRLIGEIRESSKGSITVAKCHSWEQNALTYLPACLRKGNIHC